MVLKMTLKSILSKYGSLSKRTQLNVASFKEMRSELITYCTKRGLQRERKKLEGVCAGYLNMRDGCEINSTTFQDAIREMNKYFS